MHEFDIPRTFDSAELYVEFFQELMKQEAIIESLEEKKFHDGIFHFVEAKDITTRIKIKANKSVGISE